MGVYNAKKTNNKNKQATRSVHGKAWLLATQQHSEAAMLFHALCASLAWFLHIILLLSVADCIYIRKHPCHDANYFHVHGVGYMFVCVYNFTAVLSAIFCLNIWLFSCPIGLIHSLAPELFNYIYSIFFYSINFIFFLKNFIISVIPF